MSEYQSSNDGQRRSSARFAWPVVDGSTIRLAFRNTLRHRTRSVIAVLTIGFGVIAILLAGGFIEWIFWAIREAAIQSGLGHAHVVRAGYRDSGLADPFAYLLREKSSELSLLEASPAVKAVAPRLNFSGLISHGETTLSFVGEGVNAEKEKLVSRVLHISQGEGLSDNDPQGILLGAGLAAKVGVGPGDNVVLLATSASGAISAVEPHVRGLFMSDVRAYDDTVVRAPIALARQLLKVSGSHEWVIALDETERTQRWVEEFRRRLQGGDYEIIPWFEMADFYNKSVTLLSSQMLVVRAIIGLIIVLSITNVLIMSVLERIGEIGTQLAMGTRRREILKQFLWEGVLLGLLGALFGLLSGVALAQGISAVGIPMPPPPGREAGYSGEIMLTWRLVAGALALAMLTTILASLYPAWKGSRLEIVDALRHNR